MQAKLQKTTIININLLYSLIGDTMKRRFKTKKKNKLLRLLLIIFIIIILFRISVLIIKKYYINKINNKEFITDIFSESTYNKYLDPIYILEYTSNFKEKEVIEEINPVVYIYTTHESESYKGINNEVYNVIPNVSLVSSILKEKLDNLNIITEVETSSVNTILKNNNWSYRYSYNASRQIIEPKIVNNNYKLIIDLHRDSSSLETSTLYLDNKKYARVLFVIGTEYNNYESNYNIANILNNKMNSKVNNISRGVIKKGGSGNNGIYNQDLNPNMILLEVGGPYNTLEEIINTLDILSVSIKEYIEGA